MRRRLIALMAALFITAPAAGRAMEISLFPAAELDQLYNSNVGVTSSNQQGDWITAELVGARLEASSPNRDCFLNYSTVFAENAWYQNLDRFGRDQNVQLNDSEHLSMTSSLNISDTFLRGNAASGQFYTGDAEPIGPQLMSALLYASTTTAETNAFSANFRHVNSDLLAWSSEVHQNFFSTNSASTVSNVATGLSFDQGGSLSVDRPLGERFTIGAGYRFDDFRFSNGVPSSESHMPMLRLGWGIGTPFTIAASAGPTIVSSSSGAIGATTISGATNVEPGFQLTANYAGERFTLQGSADEYSGLSAGFGGQTNNITASSLFQYKLTRRAVLFTNVGYFDFSGTGTNGYSFSYAAGASYRLTRQISLTAEYYGYRTLANGVTAGALVASPGQTVATNVLLFGVVFQAAPWKWVVD